CSKEWVYQQYDSMVRTNTAVLPGADAAVIRIKETRRALAISLDGNGKYVAINPFEGAKLVVAEAARNVVCVGAEPIAVTNCLNFASPERPEVMWSFSRTIDGMREACEAFSTPIVSGNVSFYNETEGSGILPTPVIGMVGLIESSQKILTPHFKDEGDLIALLGTPGSDLSASEYLQVVKGITSREMIASGNLPAIDLEFEKRLHSVLLELAGKGLIKSAHDCSDGGLAVALAECCFSTLGHKAIGASIKLNFGSDTDGKTFSREGLLFGESPSRIIISFSPRKSDEIFSIVKDFPITLLGEAGGSHFSFYINENSAIDAEVSELETAWRGALTSKMEMTAA
ncbi:MAG TPA: AIR synthase related protein, partial [Pyrinomonadaceae bacterium]|nr:AIR synthase related protein [Pyrinomonadaceae bacterium]